MEVTLSADLQAKLTRIAQERGTDPQALAREAIERLVELRSASSQRGAQSVVQYLKRRGGVFCARENQKRRLIFLT